MGWVANCSAGPSCTLSPSAPQDSSFWHQSVIPSTSLLKIDLGRTCKNHVASLVVAANFVEGKILDP